MPLSTRTTLFVAVLLLLLVAAACAGAVSETTTSTTEAPATTEAPETTTTIRDSEPETTTTMSTVVTTTTAPETEGPLEIVIESGEVVGGSQTFQVELGTTAHFVVVSDVEDHVHVHGYDLFFDVAPGEGTEVMFIADVPGIFEVELEGSHMLLLELEVS